MDTLSENYRVARLIARRIMEALSPEEAGELETWLAASEGHREMLARFESRLREDLRQGRRLDIEREWRAFQGRLPRRRVARAWWWASGVAAAAVVVWGMFMWLPSPRVEKPVEVARSAGESVKEYKARLILDDGRAVELVDTMRQVIAVSDGAEATTSGVSLTYEAKDSLVEASEPVRYNTLVVPRGGEFELVLADGTRVWMNSDSKLIYPVTFRGSTREVRMEGEVCFSVARNERQPFVVHAGDAAVRVLGTFFNVEAYPDEEEMTTTLVEGRVSVSVGKDAEVLTPNQQAVVREKGGIEVRTVDANAVVSWVRGVCYFSETSLEEIMDKLARWYNVEVFFADASAKAAHFSLEIERYEDVSTILSKIEKTGRVRFEVNGRTVIVRE